MAQKRVVLFTAPGCIWCSRAEQFFRKNKIRFNKIDISKDQKAAKDCERHGCRGVPVILIGSKWICGFNEAAIKKELGLK
jgi:glutaredoxin 3